VFYLEAGKSSSIITVDVLDFHERMDALITEGQYQEIISINSLIYLTFMSKTHLLL
jgi:hypothetical protein